MNEHWDRVPKCDPWATLIANRHYSRHKKKEGWRFRQFMPPGEAIVLLAKDRSAVFGWWRPAPSSGLPAMNGKDGWTCTIFRNEGGERSSILILSAELALRADAPDIGPDGMMTYVWDRKVASPNPGYCFKMAGWSPIGRSSDGQKTLLQKLLP